jgi:4,5-DOPA dioxygenase extradiol
VSTRQPAIFLGHGSPTNTFEVNRWTEAWRALGDELLAGDDPPTAVLAISAHWYIGATAVTAMAQPRTIHDFGGFADELSRFQYPAPGSPDLARRVVELLAPAQVHLDDQDWGLDHGTWSVLAHVLPDADLPVVQLSIDATRPTSAHLELGRALRPLRDEGVVVLGSGNVVHNLRLARWDELMGGAPPGPPYDWATRFDRDVRIAIAAHDGDELVRLLSSGDGRLAHPSPDHYLPLLYVVGATDADEPVRELTSGLEGGSLSMQAVQIG